MMKRSLSLTAGTLAIAWLPVTAVAADRPLEGRLESFLGKPNFQLQPISREYGRQADCVAALDGTVVVTWLQPGREGVFEANDGKNVRVRRSEDGGKSWGEEIVIAEGFTGGGTTVDETTGDILAFVEDHHPPAPLTVYRSEDHGKTWRTSDPFPLLGTGEGTVAELSDGRIYYNSRRHWAPKNENARRRRTAWSEDGGATWTDLAICEALPDGPQNTDYGCEAGLVRLPIRGRDILLYSNVDNPSRDSDSGDFYGNTKGENRHHGTVWVSFDGGRTWPLKRLAHEGAPSVTHRLSPGDRERLAKAGSTCSSMSMQGNFPFGSLGSTCPGCCKESRPATAPSRRSSPAVGKIPIQGDQVFALAQDNKTKPRAQGTWEAHRKYIDVQFLTAGVEEMGYANIKRKAGVLPILPAGFSELSTATFWILGVELPSLRKAL